MHRRLLLLFAIAGLLTVAMPGTALATWPGRTGQIAGMDHDGIRHDAVGAPVGGFFQASVGQAILSDPVYSPRGSRMANNQLGGPPDKAGLYIRNWDGSDPRRISPTLITPSWSADGKWIIGASLFLVPVDGSQEYRQLTPFGVGSPQNTDAFDPVWSSTGMIAFLDDSPATGELEVWTMKSDGTGVKQLTRTKPYGTCSLRKDSLGWSPDGKHLVFTQTVPDPTAGTCAETSKIVIMNADGSDSKRIATGTDPLFSPDNAHLLYRGGDGLTEREMAYDGSGDTQFAVLLDLGFVPTAWQSEPGTLTPKLTMGHTFTSPNALSIQATVSPVSTEEGITITLAHLVAGKWVTVDTTNAHTGPNGGFNMQLGNWFDGTCRAVLHYDGDPQYAPRNDSIKFACRP